MRGFNLYSTICLHGEHMENFTNNNNNNNTVFARDIVCLRNISINTLHKGDDDGDDDDDDNNNNNNNNNTIIIVVTSLSLL